MAITPKMQALIAQVRRQNPQLAHVSDEQVARLIMQVGQKRQARPPVGSRDLGSMTVEELIVLGQDLIKTGRWLESENVFLKALQKAENAKDYLHKAWTLQFLARLCLLRGNFSEAMTLYQQALALAERIGSQPLIGAIYDQVGSVSRKQGRLPQAIEYYKKSLQIRETGGKQADERELAVSYGNLGHAYSQQGDLPHSIEAFEKALALFIKIGDRQAIGKAYGGLGGVYRKQGRRDKAVEMHRKSLEIALRFSDKQGAATNYVNLGNVHSELGNHKEALRMYNKALDIQARLANKPAIAQIYGNLAVVCSKMGDVGQALAYYDKSLNIFEQIGDHHSAACCYFNLGNLSNKQGDMKRSRVHFEKAKALFEMVGDARWAQDVARALHRL